MYHDRTARRCALKKKKNMEAKEIQKEMLSIGAAFLWGYAASIFFAHKKRTTPRCSIVVHVFRGSAIM
jgi:hypothetical protein